MRSKSTIWLFPLLLMLLGMGIFARTSSAQTSDRSADGMERKKLSVMLLIDGSVRGMERQPMDAQRLYVEIDQNKRQHQSRDDSYALSRAFMEKQLEEDLKIRIDQILTASGLTDMDPAWCESVEADALSQGKIHIEDNLAVHADAIFGEARSKAVEEQRINLVHLATPKTREDFLNVERRSPELHKALLERSLRLYREPLLSENRDYLASQIDGIIHEAWRQFDTQRKKVRDSKGGGDRDITIDAIERAIHAEIDQYRASLKKPYPVFPSVNESIPPRSRQLAFEKFSHWAASWNDPIPKERLVGLIENDIEAHRVAFQSKQVLSQFFLLKTQAEMLSEYLRRVPSKDQRRLQAFLMEQPSFYVQIEKAVEKALRHFEEARQDVSEAQFTRLFPTLADGSWKLSETDVQRRYNQDHKTDSDRRIQNFLASKKVIEETDRLVQKAVYRLADRGDAAIMLQMSLAQDNRQRSKENVDRLFLETADSEMKMDWVLAQLVTKATKEIQEAWSHTELSESYPQLFAIVKDQIRKDIKDLIPMELKRGEEIRRTGIVQTKGQEDPAQGKPLYVQEEKTRQREKQKKEFARRSREKGEYRGTGRVRDGHSTGVSGYGAGSGENRLRDVVIDIDIENEKIVIVSVTIGDDAPFTFTFPLRKETYKNYRERVAPHLAHVEKRLADHFSERIQDFRFEPVYIVTRIFHVRVPYGLVYDLRESVQKAVNALGGKKLPVYWYDGFYLDKNPVRIVDIRKKSIRMEADFQ